MAVGVGFFERVIGADTVGTFGGYGVGGSGDSLAQPTGEVTALPLCALMAGWLRGQASPPAAVEVRVYPLGPRRRRRVAHGRDRVRPSTRPPKRSAC